MRSHLLLKDGASDAELKAVGLLPEPTKEIILYGAEREFLAHFRFGMVEDDDRFSTSKWGSQDFGRIDMVSRSLIDDISAVKADYQVQEN
ncbi:hypothetical protein KAI87_03260 [Myxococcota bacterium]|nr:hypothetical protein [Myxococcota bacterium]